MFAPCGKGTDMSVLKICAAAVSMMIALSVSAQGLTYLKDTKTDITLSASAAILIEADTGTVLYAKNEKEHRSIASTTKIMTALLTIEAGDLDKRFTVDPIAINVEGTSMGLKEGDTVTRRALCAGMLLPSGNDAANAAAISVAGSSSAFAEMMNNKAAALGMSDSRFVTPSGLDADGQYSCAYDLAVLARCALKNDVFREICGSVKLTEEYGSPPYERTLVNSNKLLYSYDGCIGVKTGFTDNAGRTLVSAAERDGVTLIAVTLNAPDDWKDHTKLLDYGFEKVRPTDAAYDCSSLHVPVIGGEQDYIGVKTQGSAALPLTAEQKEQVQVTVYLPKFIYAGVTAGETVGELRYELYGSEICSVPLAATESCAAKPQELSVIAQCVKFLRSIFNF